MARPAGILARQIFKILDWRNPLPLNGIPDDDLSRRQLMVAMDDMAAMGRGAIEQMRDQLRLFAPWMSPSKATAMIEESLTRGRRWTNPGEIAELAEMFGMSEAERDGLGIRQVRPVHAEGRAFSDDDMKVRRRVRKTLGEAKYRREKASIAAHAPTVATSEPELSPRERFIHSKIDLRRRSSTEIAKAVKRSHGYIGSKKIGSVRKAVLRAIDRLVAAGLVEIDDQTGSKGQDLRFVRRKR